MSSMDSNADRPTRPVERLALARDEIRFEIGLLHARVNALLTAESFLVIAYTAAMSNAAPWGKPFAAVASPVLALLGLLLALLGRPGIDATARIVLGWTARQAELVDRAPAPEPGAEGPATSGRRLLDDQRRSMLFFRAVPYLFGAVWAVLAALALLLPNLT